MTKGNSEKGFETEITIMGGETIGEGRTMEIKEEIETNIKTEMADTITGMEAEGVAMIIVIEITMIEEIEIDMTMEIEIGEMRIKMICLSL